MTTPIEQASPDDKFNGLTRSEVSQGRRAINSMLEAISYRVPTVDQLQPYIPILSDFIDPVQAAEKESVHGQVHIVRTLILAPPFIRFCQKFNPGFTIPEQAIMQSLSIHDLDVVDSINNPNHGPHVVQRFEESGQHKRYGDNWRVIKFIVNHHSERFEHKDPETPFWLKHALWIAQDTDASELARGGVNMPVSLIHFRTMEARILGLAYIDIALRNAARSEQTGDPLEDQIQAALKLGLIRPDPVIVYEQT